MIILRDKLLLFLRTYTIAGNQFMNCQIRKASKEDVSSVYHFICLLEETIFEYAGFEKIFYSNVSSKNCRYMVAVNDVNEVIGFISCHIQQLLHHGGSVAEIQELFVVKTYRKAGVGKALVNTLLEKLVQDKVTSVEVTAQTKRLKTHTFYEAAGFIYSHKKFTRKPK